MSAGQISANIFSIHDVLLHSSWLSIQMIINQTYSISFMSSAGIQGHWVVFVFLFFSFLYTVKSRWMLLSHLKRTNNVYAAACSIYCLPSPMFAYAIIFCLMLCGTPTWVSGPTVPEEHVQGKKWYFWCSYWCTGHHIPHDQWQFLMRRWWFKNTNVDTGRPCILLLPLNPAILFSVQSAGTALHTHWHTYGTSSGHC